MFSIVDRIKINYQELTIICFVYFVVFEYRMKVYFSVTNNWTSKFPSLSKTKWKNFKFKLKDSNICNMK